MILVSARHLPRAPLPAQSVTSYGVVYMHNIREHYLSFIAHTGSCARPNSSCHLDFTLDQQVFAGCCESLLEDGPSRHYLRNPCVGAWTPTPQRPFSAFARFFLKDNGLTLDVRGSARRICPCNATSTGLFFSRLQSFLYVQAPTLARPPGCTHR
jgi:hypothetical protein